MKLTLLVGCVALGVVGCATERYDREYNRGGVNSPYETEYGSYRSDWTAAPYWETQNSIYPVRRQPSPNGREAGGVKPLIDPARQYDWDTYYRDYPPRVPVPEAPLPPVPPPPSEVIP